MQGASLWRETAKMPFIFKVVCYLEGRKSGSKGKTCQVEIQRKADKGAGPERREQHRVGAGPSVSWAQSEGTDLGLHRWAGNAPGGRSPSVRRLLSVSSLPRPVRGSRRMIFRGSGSRRGSWCLFLGAPQWAPSWGDEHPLSAGLGRCHLPGGFRCVESSGTPDGVGCIFPDTATRGIFIVVQNPLVKIEITLISWEY